MENYRSRAVDPLIRDLLQELPALLLVGPRATGKTTTALRYAASVVRLDRPREAAAFEADPDAALRDLEEPVLVDEWQSVPGVLGAIKRSIDRDPRPGRFLVTGSVRADLASATWPGTGRLVRVPVFGLTMAEQLGRRVVPLVDRVARGDHLLPASGDLDLRSYVECALRSGFPEPALSLSDQARAHWIESYVDQMLTRDAEAVSQRDPVKLRKFFEAYALNSAGVADDKTIYEAAGINRKTSLAYEHLLTNLLVVEAVPSWTENRLRRLVRRPKRYMVDAALAAGALRLNPQDVVRDGNLLGRVLDTFVLSQLRPETVVAEGRPRFYHAREEHGRYEVDLLAELGGGRVVAVEVKASASPGERDAKHLAWLRDRSPDRFIGGVVLHTGPRTYGLGDRIVAAPISTLWAG